MLKIIWAQKIWEMLNPELMEWQMNNLDKWVLLVVKILTLQWWDKLLVCFKICPLNKWNKCKEWPKVWTTINFNHNNNKLNNNSNLNNLLLQMPTLHHINNLLLKLPVISQKLKNTRQKEMNISKNKILIRLPVNI